MPSILEQNLLLLKTYQNTAMANNCSIDTEWNHLASTDLNDTFASTEQTDNNIFNLPPCNSSLLSDVHSLVASFELDNFTSMHNETFSMDTIDSYETNRYFIKNPHDMLHPSEINPGIVYCSITTM